MSCILELKRSKTCYGVGMTKKSYFNMTSEEKLAEWKKAAIMIAVFALLIGGCAALGSLGSNDSPSSYDRAGKRCSYERRGDVSSDYTTGHRVRLKCGQWGGEYLWLNDGFR